MLIFITFIILNSAISAKDTGLIFVSNEKSHEIIVIDPETYEIIKSIKTSKRPRDLEWNSDKSKFVRKNLNNSKRCFAPCNKCDVVGDLVGQNHANAWQKYYSK